MISPEIGKLQREVVRYPVVLGSMGIANSDRAIDGDQTGVFTYTYCHVDDECMLVQVMDGLIQPARATHPEVKARTCDIEDGHDCALCGTLTSIEYVHSHCLSGHETSHSFILSCGTGTKSLPASFKYELALCETISGIYDTYSMHGYELGDVGGPSNGHRRIEVPTRMSANGDKYIVPYSRQHRS
jgi:hypothetical protein